MAECRKNDAEWYEERHRTVPHLRYFNSRRRYWNRPARPSSRPLKTEGTGRRASQQAMATKVPPAQED
jgi:hypothetical protein